MPSSPHLNLGVRKALGDLGHDVGQALGNLAGGTAGQGAQGAQGTDLGLPGLGLCVCVLG